jgi:hypothetical protein
MSRATAVRAAARRIDTAWFYARIRASRYRSMRRLAPHLANTRGRPMANSGLVLVLHGRRPLRIGQARQLADLLGVPLPEVIRRAGVDVRDEGDDVEARLRVAVRMVGTLLAFVDEAGVAVPRRVRDQAAAIR